ncbi:ATP-dependent zinc metalloprotease FtsH [Pontibacillus marinus]|uniref:ATP-dependent zinc metalloprotease FtsH n=1 Tax=Pontibacillus marinus BH030004 = DSM 16465 TaxID=1385511 RepID=A0A0A5FSM9_9BACI|nr:ATP-dependent zinc metalloprotease FtsH [Pontibacillus marinus]KGX83791.1 cell division protein FtsH [Pontibacillus marinus BH030004 = DSM 16465]
MNRVFRNTIFYALIFLVVIGVVGLFNSEEPEDTQLNYNQFMQKLNNGQIEEMTYQYTNQAYNISGTLTSTGEEGENESFTATFPDNEIVEEQMLNTAQEQGTVVENLKAEEPSGWVRFFTSIIPFVIIFILFFFLLNQAQGGGGKVMNFGKSKAKLFSEDKKKVRFKDVAGADEEKQELVEVVDFLKDPRKFAAIGARIPKGVLLVGPPGTGKTLLARAVAGEAGVPFFSISGSDFVEMFVGVGASRVRDLFENAKKNAPCIIFIDEIDAVGRQRGAGLGGGHDEREQTLNQLLVEMDGFGANEGIIIIAATNRPDILDPALLRPGRFDRQITVNRPDLKGRQEVLKVHVQNKTMDEDSVDLKTIAMRTPGFSGADLENLLNEAALVAARADKEKIDMQSIDEAIDRVIAGPAKKSRVISNKERNIVAYHESGHTIIGMVLDEADAVHKVTIVPRGQAGGYAVMLPKEDRFMMTKPELLDKIIGLLGGRVAEEVIFGEVSTGAHNDFQRATSIARKMVTEYGMSEKLGPLQFGGGGGQVFLGRDIQNEQNYSDQIAYEIDQEVQRIIKECYDRAKQILTDNKEQLELIAQTLLKVETLDASEIKSLFEDGVMPEESEHKLELAENKEKEKNSSESNSDVKVNIQSKDEEQKQSDEESTNDEENRKED